MSLMMSSVSDQWTPLHAKNMVIYTKIFYPTTITYNPACQLDVNHKKFNIFTDVILMNSWLWMNDGGRTSRDPNSSSCHYVTGEQIIIKISFLFKLTLCIDKWSHRFNDVFCFCCHGFYTFGASLMLS